MNNEAIAKKIEALPVCKDGKAAVTELLKEFGYQPAPPAPPVRYPKRGEVWRDIGMDSSKKSFLFITDNKTDEKEAGYRMLMNYDLLGSGSKSNLLTGWLTAGGGGSHIVFFANSIEEALAKAVGGH